MVTSPFANYYNLRKFGKSINAMVQEDPNQECGRVQEETSGFHSYGHQLTTEVGDKW